MLETALARMARQLDAGRLASKFGHIGGLMFRASGVALEGARRYGPAKTILTGIGSAYASVAFR
jgi:hypothetical protein